MIHISVAKDRVIGWLLETEKDHGPGYGCPILHDGLELAGLHEDLVGELLKQPWMKAREPNRMWTEDREALFDWLVEHGILSEEQRAWLDVKHTLALMEG